MRNYTPRDGEQFATFTPDRKFRVYTLPSAGLIELEEMDDEGQMQDLLDSTSVGVVGYTQEYRERVVNNFRMLLNVWVCQNKGNHDRRKVIATYDSMQAIAIAMSQEI